MSANAIATVVPGRTFSTHGQIKPQPRERVRPRGPYHPKSLIGASDTGQLPGYGDTKNNGKVVIAIAALPDTDRHATRRGKLQRVAINANRNCLEREHSDSRLSYEAYAAGKIFESLLERSHGMHNPSRGEWLMPQGGNPVNGQANALAGRLDDAKFLVAEFRATSSVIGMTGHRILELCLVGTGVPVEGQAAKGPLTFSEVAECMQLTLRAQNETDASFHKRCKADGMKIGWAFRDALKLLASHWELGDSPKLRKWGG